MLQLHAFTFNPFSENTYVVFNEQHDCWIFDPGMYEAAEVNALTSWLEEKGLTPKAIINTHAHIDHIFGIQPLTAKYNIPFYLHEADVPLIERSAQQAAMFGLAWTAAPPHPTRYLTHGEMLDLGTDRIEVRYAPGHAPGHVVFYHAPGNWLIGGDVLFAGSIGRTDLPGGDMDTLLDSIRTQLFTLPDETIVLPGHGGATTIGEEKATNPYLR